MSAPSRPVADRPDAADVAAPEADAADVAAPDAADAPAPEAADVAAPEAMAVSDEVRRPGRPRDPQADAAILEATIDILCEQGFGAFTVDAVATQAGVGKATIYRRWPNREALVLDAAATLIRPTTLPDTGNLRDDLVALFTEAYVGVDDQRKSNLMAGVVAESLVNPEMKRLLADFTRRRRETSSEILRRGFERGELPAGTDVDLLSDIVGGTMLYRGLISDHPVDAATIATVVDVVIAGLEAAAP